MGLTPIAFQKKITPMSFSRTLWGKIKVHITSHQTTRVFVRFCQHFPYTQTNYSDFTFLSSVPRLYTSILYININVS